MRSAGYFWGVVVAFLGVCAAYAAPVEIPLNLKQEKNDCIVTMIGESDVLAQRDLAASGSGMNAAVDEGTFLSLKAYGNFEIAPVVGNVYALIGEARDLTYKASFSGTAVEYNINNSLLAGGGVCFEVAPENDNYLRHFIDLSYRQIIAAGYDSVSAGSVNASGAALEPSVRPQYYELQAAAGVCKKIKQFLPYVGLKISDVEASAQARVSGTTYRLTADSDKHFGCFAGCSFLPFDQIGMDVQARYGEEKAIALRGFYSF